MTREACRSFQTTDIDLSAYLSASTLRTPSIFRDKSTGKAVFEFLYDQELEAQLVEYASATALCNVRRLLAARRRLFHGVRRTLAESAGETYGP